MLSCFGYTKKEGLLWVMEKSVIPDEKVEELFCYEVNREGWYTKCIGVTKSGKYYIVETHELLNTLSERSETMGKRAG